MFLEEHEKGIPLKKAKHVNISDEMMNLGS